MTSMNFYCIKVCSFSSFCRIDKMLNFLLNFICRKFMISRTLSIWTASFNKVHDFILGKKTKHITWLRFRN